MTWENERRAICRAMLDAADTETTHAVYVCWTAYDGFADADALLGLGSGRYMELPPDERELARERATALGRDLKAAATRHGEPEPTEARLIDRTIGCARFVYNLMLETRIAHYQTTWESCRPTPALYKDTYPFLREVDSLALCNAQLALEKAYRRFFDNGCKGFPRYKSKRHGKAAYTTNRIGGNIKLDDKARRLKLPKIGWLAVRQHKHIPNDWKLKSVTVEHRPSGRYTATILFERETQTPEQVEPVRIVGLDYASHGLYVSSDGKRAEYPGYYRKTQDKLARGQRRLSRMVEGSANWYRQKQRVARLSEKTADQRRDWQHKKANGIAAAYDMVAVETLSLKGITSKPKPKPDPDHPGHFLHNGRKAKSGLAKSTLGNAYGMFCTMLEYKLARQGKRLVRVDRWFPSSQLCHDCGYRNPQTKDLDVREWTCPQCGVLHDRDVNAALNIRDEARRIVERRDS